MIKIALNLPKYRLQLHLRMIKRRKGFIEETVLPELEEIKKVKKENKRSKISYLFRYVFQHKNIRKILGGNLALMIIASSFFPARTIMAQESPLNNGVISVIDTPIKTEAGIQLPVEKLKINQGYFLFHLGVDLDGNIGDPIRPIMEGKVVEIQQSHYNYGNAIVIEHGNQYSSLYAHLSEIDVKLGQEVTTKDIIGKVGSTGHSTGSHLHLEVRDHGIPINPLSILPKN